jgi:hypothetical protein
LDPFNAYSKIIVDAIGFFHHAYKGKEKEKEKEKERDKDKDKDKEDQPV